jgi:NaMN:DMB phosphoribosyltransferase
VSLGTGILLSLGFAFIAALVVMVISDTAKDMTLTTTKNEEAGHSH